jgi:UDP-N-acetylmuramoylalanine--D-glutamate ligase
VSLTFDHEVSREDFRGQRVTIVGLGKGRTASGLARFLVSSGARVTITDAQPREELAQGLARLGDTPVELVLGPSSDDAALADPDLVFVLPGIRPRSATILRALGRHIPVMTEMGLFFRLCPATIVGITGTKGKTTTTTMIGGILSRGPRSVVVGGNIGRSVIQELDTLKREDIVVLELSSFQLETLGRSPHVAVVTNIGEDHLDHHGTRENYIAAKRNIVAW